MKRLELRVEGGGYKGKRFSVPPAGLRVGRSSSNDVPIHDEELSRNHCLFEASGETGVRLTDLASANGTFLNEVRMGSETVDLKLGDVIRVGSTSITVVDESSARVNFDLGLGTQVWKKPDGAKVSPKNAPKGVSRRLPLANVLWGVVVLVFGFLVYLLLKTPSAPEPKKMEIVDREEELIELRYEKVVANSETIFRYAIALTPDGYLSVTMDDLAGEGRHIDKRTSAPLNASAKKWLKEIVLDEGFSNLDPEYTGPDEEPPKLNSCAIRYYTDASRKSVKVVNTQEPVAFRRVQEKLEEFSKNELGIRALQLPRAELIRMAREVGDAGQQKWEERDVEYGNLYEATQLYREAIADLETVNPKPPEFETYRKALERAEKELDTRYKDQRFVVQQAQNMRDWTKMKEELGKLRDMVPNREDARYQEAERLLIEVEKHFGKKGGRK